jgi:acyl carrier protein
MTDVQLTEVIYKALGRIVPEADLTLLPLDANVRDTLDMDSFDHLQFLVHLSELLGVEVPEEDYGDLTTLADIVRYLTVRVR